MIKQSMDQFVRPKRFVLQNQGAQPLLPIVNPYHLSLWTADDIGHIQPCPVAVVFGDPFLWAILTT